MSKKTDAVLAEAILKSKDFLASIAPNRVAHRINAERIVEVCQALVSAKPAVDPRSPAVSERGKTLYGKFPAEQSMLNRYGTLLRIWREAFTKLINASLPTPRASADQFSLNNDELTQLDHGTRARVVMMAAVLREKRLEVERLNKIILDRLPAPGQECSAETHPETAPKVRIIVQEWLDSMSKEGSKLIVGDDGARTTAKARPDTLIVPISILNLLKQIAAASGSSGEQKDK